MSPTAARARSARPLPDHVVPLGRTLGLPMNGAVSNLATFPKSVGLLGRELRHGGYDVVHVHEPNAAVPQLVRHRGLDGAGRRHLPHATRRAGLVEPVRRQLIGARRLYAKLSARIAVSEAARWTAQRYYGGRYRDRPERRGPVRGARRTARAPTSSLRIVFVGRAEERKGLPVLLRAFEALRGVGVPARLTVAGATAEEVEPLLLDPEGVEIAGQVDDAEKWKLLGEADLLCAPSLGGESFGMVLTEAFASGTPVVASDIAGYRDVVRNGSDGVLVPVGDAVALGETLLDARRRPGAPRARWARPRASAPSGSRGRTSPRRSSPCTRRLSACPSRTAAWPAPRSGSAPCPPSRGPRVRPKRLPSLEPKEPGARAAARRRMRPGGS